MISAKQKQIRIFDIKYGSSEELREYIEKNLPIFKEYLLSFASLDDASKEFLQERGLGYIDRSTFNAAAIEKKAKEPKRSAGIEELGASSDTKNAQEAEPRECEKEHAQTLLLNRTIRSGEVIEHGADITVFGRLNSGAKLKALGNVTMFGHNEGFIECEGEYMLLNLKGKGAIVFNGEILEPKEYNNRNVRVIRVEDSHAIEEI